MASDILIGIDLGGTNTKVAIVSREKEILSRQSRVTPATSGPDVVLAFVCDFALEVLKDAGLHLEDVIAVGVGAPGPMNWQTGLVYTLTNFEGWENVPIAQSIQERLDGVPCFVDNDANVACYGEYWLGAGRGCQTMGLLTLGTGVGGGVVINGELLHGIDGTAGEIGHIIVERDGRLCGCGARGCLEAYASVPGMVRTASDGIREGRETLLIEACEDDHEKITGAIISECAGRGDEFCAEVIRETGIWLGTGIVGVVNLLNPERIVLCGGMIQAGELLFAPIRETVKALALDVPAERVEILPAGLGPDSGVIGAAGCALARL